MDEYYSALDRGMYEPKLDPNTLYNTVPTVDYDIKPDYQLPVNELGTTQVLAGNNTDPVRMIQSEIRKGVGHLEISANQTGAGRGQGNKGYEEIDTEERQAIRDIQRAVEGFDLTTHATPAVHGGTGFDGERSQFSERRRKFMQDEIKKAIDFASDATFGGSVVIHTGEFHRPMFNMPGHEGLFESHPFEDQDAGYLLVDTKSSSLISQVKEDQEVWLPVQKKDKNNKPLFMQTLTKDNEIAAFDDDITQTQIPIYETDERGEIKFEKLSFSDFVEKQLEDPEKIKEIKKYISRVDPARANDPIKKNSVYVREALSKDFYKEQERAKISYQLGQARQYVDQYNESLKERDKILKQLQLYKKLKEEYGDDWKQFEREIKTKEFLPPEVIDPVEHLQEMLNRNERNIGYGRELTISGIKEARKELDKVNAAKTYREFALDKSYHTYAELGLYAMDKTNAMKQTLTHEDDKKKIKPIAITMENIFPEEFGYGSGADEIIDLIKNSRKRMKQMLTEDWIPDPRGKTASAKDVEKLKEKGVKIQEGDTLLMQNPYKRNNISAKEAEKIAADHIKMTFDTGHFNMWRKYYKRKSNETDQQFDERFKKWYLKEVDKLAESGVIGNVHLADNFGYDDNHLAPGQGNAPIQEALKRIKTKDYKGSIAVEGGWGQGKGLHDVWSAFHSPIMSKKRSDAWTSPGTSLGMDSAIPLYGSPLQGPAFGEVQDGYLGRMHRPYFMFGAYNTGAQEDNKPWSQTNME